MEIEEEKLKMQNEKNRLMQAKTDAAKGKRHHVGLDSKWKMRRLVDDVSLTTGKLAAEKENIPKKAPVKVISCCDLINIFCSWLSFIFSAELRTIYIFTALFLHYSQVFILLRLIQVPAIGFKIVGFFVVVMVII
jgi:hypothetical protein